MSAADDSNPSPADRAKDIYTLAFVNPQACVQAVVTTVQDVAPTAIRVAYLYSLSIALWRANAEDMAQEAIDITRFLSAEIASQTAKNAARHLCDELESHYSECFQA